MPSFLYKKNNKVLSLGGISNQGKKSYINFPINEEDYPLLNSKIYTRNSFVFDDAEFIGQEIVQLALEFDKLYLLIYNDDEYSDITKYQIHCLAIAIKQLADFDSEAILVFYSD